jgi:hypothetical protein
MEFGSGKTYLPKPGPLPLVIADENNQVIYGKATLKQIQEAGAKLSEEEKERLPPPAFFLAPISIEILICYFRIRYGDHPVVRRRLPSPHNIVVSEDLLGELTEKIILTVEDGEAIKNLQDKFDESGIPRPHMHYVSDEEADKLMAGRKWESPWKKRL